MALAAVAALAGSEVRKEPFCQIFGRTPDFSQLKPDFFVFGQN